MNGVRRFLGGGPSNAQPQSESPPAPVLPLNPKPGPSWPPESSPPRSSVTLGSSPKASTAALSLKKDKPRPPIPGDELANKPSRHTPTPSSDSVFSNGSYPGRISRSDRTALLSVPKTPPMPSRLITRKSAEPETPSRSSTLNTRDELLFSLLASEAVVDCRDLEILTSEEVDELKKEEHVLLSRVEAMNKKLALETKIRDAAVSLAKVNAAHKKVSKQSEEQLEAVNRRVETAQKELWRISERSNEVHKKLMEHRAGVLSLSVRNMEKKINPSSSLGNGDSGYNTPSNPMSPISSVTGFSSSSKPRFDGAHLFAGHADAIVPKKQRTPEELGALEEKLRAATDALSTAGKKQAEMTRELQLLRLEKEKVETVLGMEIQTSKDTIEALERELPKLEGLDEELEALREEKRTWEEERDRFMAQQREAEEMRRRLDALETGQAQAAGAERLLNDLRESSRAELEKKDAELCQLQSEWDADRRAWENERSELQDEKMDDLARLQEESDSLREEDAQALRKANAELDEGLAAIQSLIRQHEILLFTRDSSLPGLLMSVGKHLDGLKGKLDSFAKAESEWVALRQKLEDDVRSGLDKRESLFREVEEARHEREEARKEVRSLEIKLKDQSLSQSPVTPTAFFPPSDISGDSTKILSILHPLWSTLPSPEARAAKFTNQSKFRTGSPTPSSPGGANNGVKSLSDLDVRSLKTLYDTRATQSPASPNPASTFTIEGFAARVQALIADDKALVERLIRFAQAHDLLKKNAERAQKLAQESNNALETYQKQVRTLEERNMTLSSKQAALQDEVAQLQDTIDQISRAKQELEMQAAAQAETCEQLTEANNTLSAKTLALAEEAASAPERVRKELEAQLAETRAALDTAQAEVDRMRMSEQTQRIALLDELNALQTDNGQLREQLRALKR